MSKIQWRYGFCLIYLLFFFLIKNWLTIQKIHVWRSQQRCLTIFKKMPDDRLACFLGNFWRYQKKYLTHNCTDEFRLAGHLFGIVKHLFWKSIFNGMVHTITMLTSISHIDIVQKPFKNHDPPVLSFFSLLFVLLKKAWDPQKATLQSKKRCLAIQ